MTSGRWQPGDLYEDCAHHPVWCYLAERVTPWWRPWRRDWDLCGVSLLDGSRPRSCSARYCGVRRLTLDEALSMRGAWEAGR